jgi:tetratricopeptide (TPR) repeat protein
MTNCTGTPAEQLVESYLLGTLPEDEALKFEEHYFDCPVCLAQVEALQAVAGKLRSEPRRPARVLIPWPIRFAAVGAIAAALVVGFFALRAGHQAQRPLVAQSQAVATPQAMPPAQAKPASPESAAVSQLADLTLPVFRAANLRGENGSPEFAAGMTAYTKQDCPAAVKALARVRAADEDSRAARFYGGVCEMHEGELDAAAKTLKHVANAGDSPQQEAALYYLAQIALAGNDRSAARHYLSQTVSLHGDFEKRAHAELNLLR